jgi:hypothetical protein
MKVRLRKDRLNAATVAYNLAQIPCPQCGKMGLRVIKRKPDDNEFGIGCNTRSGCGFYYLETWPIGWGTPGAWAIVEVVHAPS